MPALLHAACEAPFNGSALLVRGRQGYIPGKGTSYGFWNVNSTWEDLWNCQAAFPADFDAYAQGPNRTQRYRSLQVSDMGPSHAAAAGHPIPQG